MVVSPSMTRGHFYRCQWMASPILARPSLRPSILWCTVPSVSGVRTTWTCSGICGQDHYHFESIEEALTHGADIIPKMQEIQRFPQPRRVGDTESGDAIRSEIAVLKRLVAAYQEYVI